MTDDLTPMGSAAVRLAERSVRLRRERDRARDLACAYEAQLAKVWALAEAFRVRAGMLAPPDDWGDSIDATIVADTLRGAADDLRAVLQVPDE